ncbi:hypothetical protein Cycma_4675 [Cyclobacterium marinum DSM 745]|uniref:Uncharacterized protein n=1 Tax=Cyclobacterium marinum (strain ATCC 25205 / DSM 745 / LMG 13164 / NCIMB 1802) TaxID=880070 RepID=G0J4C1_CYCMS|nr:hypothetical protein Cycma_4675 [Cyclobacterium marinum DSM 745]
MILRKKYWIIFLIHHSWFTFEKMYFKYIKVHIKILI